MTPRQQEILAFVKRFIVEHGYPPTRIEISTEFGFASHNAAEEHLKALARHGVIWLIPGTARGIRLLDADV